MSKQEKMFALMRQWERSGQSKAEFARRAGLSANLMSYWYRRYQEELPGATTSQFVQIVPDELQIQPPVAGCARIRLELPDGLVVVIY